MLKRHQPRQLTKILEFFQVEPEVIVGERFKDMSERWCLHRNCRLPGGENNVTEQTNYSNLEFTNYLLQAITAVPLLLPGCSDLMKYHQSHCSKVGLTIIKVPKGPLHLIPKSFRAPISITKLTLTSQH